ncbi:MAG: NAD(P)/FAD-dependent oxidoreductase [Alphaproteobacteria bacterium]
MSDLSTRPPGDAASGGIRDAAAGGAPHIVIVGAGFGGLETALALGGSTARVTVVDRTNHHLFQPLLYQVATSVLSEDEVAQPIRQILRRHANIDTVLGEVVGVDTAARRVVLKDGYLDYDLLVLATGAGHGYFGNDAWERFAPGLKTLTDARTIRSRVLLAFERAERTDDPDERRRLMTVAVVGGGPTGVEMAGALAELARYTLAGEFRRIDPRATRILLFEAGPRILPQLPEDLASYAAAALARRGVEVRTDTMVEDISADAIETKDGTVPVGMVVWSAGVAASPVGEWLGVETDKPGRVRVDPDLSVPGHPGIFVIGDVAHAAGPDGEPLPGLAQVAKQQGRHLGRGLRARVEQGTPLPPFAYRNRGNLATISRNAAVADFGGFKLRGFVAWLLWGLVHVYLLVGFQNRMVVSVRWLWAWLSHRRSARIIAADALVAFDHMVPPEDDPEAEADPRHPTEDPVREDG